MSRRAIGCLLVAAACGTGCDVFLPAKGGADQPCLGGGVCDDGLVCVEGACQAEEAAPPAAVCGNGLQDGDETDTDCGGSECEPCGLGLSCGEDRDCSSGHCLDSTCQEEEPAPGEPCEDGARGGGETDVDCGGPDCPKCADGLQCVEGTDCSSGHCLDSTCQEEEPAPGEPCEDGARGGGETDVDCGGPDCPKCADGLQCVEGTDCSSGRCDGVCAALPAFRDATLPDADHAQAVDFMPLHDAAGDLYLATGSTAGVPRVWKVFGDPWTAVRQVETPESMDHIADDVTGVVFQPYGQAEDPWDDYLYTVDSARGVYRHRVVDWTYAIVHDLGARVLVTTKDVGEPIASAGKLHHDPWEVAIRDREGADTGTHLDLESEATCLAFSPYSEGPPVGYLLAAGSRAVDQANLHGLHVWHSEGWQSRSGPQELGHRVLDLAFHPELPLLAVVVEDLDDARAIHVYDTNDWSHDTVAPVGAVGPLVFVPGGRRLLAGSDGGVLQAICDAGEGWTSTGSDSGLRPDALYDLAVSQDGRWLAGGTAGRARVWDLTVLMPALGCPVS